MTRTSGAPIGCQRPSRFWGLGCPKIYHEAEDTLDPVLLRWPRYGTLGFTRIYEEPENENGSSPNGVGRLS
ncbi:hypothetical protein [Thiolapillus sp.]|uniref:hypothetical protein n=1 Tax=Thiolapillus sp. TaxID=2017437 RepID=UPI0025D819BC|nr:hypothetical protein [Thiolapillus sp.]